MTRQRSEQTRGHFNSQPHEEADIAGSSPFRSLLYFNSQPHEEADNFSFPSGTEKRISTRSLTRRLTKGSYLIRKRFLISTRSLTRRLTPLRHACCFNPAYFNSQPHEEADQALENFPLLYHISTRSLTRRLTLYVLKYHHVALIFQLAASRGG